MYCFCGPAPTAIDDADEPPEAAVPVAPATGVLAEDAAPSPSLHPASNRLASSTDDAERTADLMTTPHGRATAEQILPYRIVGMLGGVPRTEARQVSRVRLLTAAEWTVAVAAERCAIVEAA